MKLSKAQLQKRLDGLAREISAISQALTVQYGDKAYLYFEAGGQIHAMRPEPPLTPGRDSTMRERQALIIASSENCHFDCGAW